MRIRSRVGHFKFHPLSLTVSFIITSFADSPGAFPTAKNTSERRRAAAGAPSVRRRSAVGPPSERRRCAICAPSGRRQSKDARAGPGTRVSIHENLCVCIYIAPRKYFERAYAMAVRIRSRVGHLKVPSPEFGSKLYNYKFC